MRLCDADALRQTFCAECDHSIKCEDCDIDYHFEHLAPTVDIDAITESHERTGYDRGFRDGYAEALEATDNAEPVKHGHWILSEDRYCKTCSECGVEVDVSMGLGIFVDNIELDEMNYCPHCGAKMDEVEDETN